jgi:hypothetical protein
VEGSEVPADRQESELVHNAYSIAVLALAGNVFGFLVFGAVSFSVILALVFLSTNGEGSVYDQIGGGGISREGEGPGAAEAPAPDSVAAEREREIRQMLSARSERRVRKGQPALDIDAEVERLLAVEQGGRTSSPRDAGLLAEVRQLVVARNDRRVRQGLQPLDVDIEVARTLEELEP